MNTPSYDDLNDFGRARFEDDYAARPGRATDGQKHQDRESVVFGWTMMAQRHRLWSYFTDDALTRWGVR